MATGATFQNIFFPPIPLNITGCQLWLDAADPTTVTGTTTVTQWRDKSGNGRNLGNGSGTTSYANNAITLNSSYMFVTSAVNLISVTVFIVVKTTGGNNQTVFTGRPNSNVNWDSLDGFGFYMDSTSAIRFYGQQPTGKFSTFSVNTSTPRLFSFQSIGTSVSGWYDGVSQSGGTLASTRTSTAQGFAIGGEWNGSSYGNFIVNASLYEIIVYNSDLTNNQRQQVEGYLAWKWGLQGNLPSDHPYKNAAPTNTPTLNTSQITTIPLTIQKYRAFIPTQISGCQLWLDGADPAGTGILPANEATVLTWADKSGNGFNATAAPSRTAGTYSTSFRAVNFPTSTTGYITNYSAAPTNETMFVVFNNPSASYNNNILIGGVQGARSLGAAYNGNVGNSSVVGNLNTQVAWLANVGTYTLGTTALVTSQFTTSTNTISLNGGTAGSGGAPGFTAGRVTYLGVDATNGSFYYIGYAMEIIFYNSVLNTTERQQVEGYLAWKWGLQANLPAGHPYKNINNNYNPFPSTTPAFTRSISSIFKPTNYTGCQLWLDAWDPLGNGSRQKSPLTLTRWIDKSTNARHANMFNGSSISYSPTAFNNRPALLFTQTQNMSSAAAAGTFPTAFTFFMIYQRTGGGTYDTLVTRTVGNLAAPTDFFTIVGSGNFARNIGNGTAYADYNTTSGSNFTNVTTPSLYYANATSANGALDAFNFATPTDPSSGTLTGVYYGDTGTAIYIGTRADSVTKLTASVAEIIVYSTTPTAQQRQQIEGYLAWKWGLVASLPASHPYKNYPPPPQ